jgi:cytochrome c-type biogenesis protein CcmE
VKPKHTRLLLLVITLCLLTAAVLLTLRGLRQSVVYFYTPSELNTATIMPGKVIRLGGLVESGSYRVQRHTHTFRVTDGTRTIRVVYDGLLPSLFREGQGVVADGALRQGGLFKATRLLAKHDEKYMPPDVAKALKKSGKWRTTD